MHLTAEQVAHFDRDGYLILPACFSDAEIALLGDEVRHLFAEDSPRRVLEKNGDVRSVFAPNLSSDVFARLARLERLLGPAQQLLRSDVYLHQYKINAKAALGGDQWEWHQDFLYWHKEDGMPTSKVLTAVLFLQAVDEFNGPMLVIPGSQAGGMVDVEADPRFARPAAEATPSYASTLTADLKYKITKDILAGLLRERGMASVQGPAGFVLLFDGNLFHASSCNLSPNDRLGVFLTYNSVTNALRPVATPRPTFIANRDFTPLEPLPDDALERVAVTVR